MRIDCVSLTTDYGLADGFVAACHGVLARLAPAVRVIDITHLVPPADVRRGATVLAQTVPYLPVGVHVGVVDPGVGTTRRGIALATPGGQLVGPDNGLLLDAADALGGITAAVDLTNPEWLAPVVSRTFHGRDVFAPVAARLAVGAPLTEAGPPVDPAALVRLPAPVVRAEPVGFTAEVLTVDHFGNVQLAAPGELLDPLPERVRVVRQSVAHRDNPDARLQLGGPDAAPPRRPRSGGSGVEERSGATAEAVAVHGRTFGDAAAGALVAYVDSAGLVALAVNTGRAVDLLGVHAGDVLTVTAA